MLSRIASDSKPQSTDNENVPAQWSNRSVFSRSAMTVFDPCNPRPVARERCYHLDAPTSEHQRLATNAEVRLATTPVGRLAAAEPMGHHADLSRPPRGARC